MKLNYNWKLADGYPELNKGKVFSCFACGGGSTMGYKLVGFDVIGCNEIDPRMMEAYIINHKPKFSYLEDIRIFKNRTDLPKELYELDILDGSPPCSSFSMAGSREDGWGVEKKFREGQSEQVLDTLFFDFIDLANKLQPKVVIAENVKGLLLGEAREYYKKISFAFEDAGYEIQDFLLNSADMGVPQSRERVFFIGIRKDLAKPFMEQINLFYSRPKLEIYFNEKHIPVRDFIKTKQKKETQNYSATRFGDVMLDLNKPSNTITGGIRLWINEHTLIHDDCLNLIGSFPTDYNFMGQRREYIIGMSVPPLMVARIANEIYEQWLRKIK